MAALTDGRPQTGFAGSTTSTNDGALARRALVVVAKHPVAGQVKTRLAPALDARQSLRLYEAFLNDIARQFAGGDYDFAFAYTPPNAPFDGRGHVTYPQDGPTLNDRLLNIFKRNCGRYPAGTLVMSSDSPQVRPEWIERGFALLRLCDVVIGPTDDGGYWTVGMREAHDIFSGVPMSTPTVMERTLERIRSLGLRAKRLPKTFDIDTARDIELLRALLKEDRSAALAATRHALEEIDNHKWLTST